MQRLLVMSDKSHAEEFGAWLAGQRNALGITVREAARRAEISEGQWGRIEKGESGTKRSTVQKLLAALRIGNTDEAYLEGFLKAGYAPSDELIISQWDVPGSIQNNPNGLRYEPIDYAAYEAFLRGLPPQLQQEEYDRLKRIWMEHQRGQTDFGKKVEDE